MTMIINWNRLRRCTAATISFIISILIIISIMILIIIPWGHGDGVAAHAGVIIQQPNFKIHTRVFRGEALLFTSLAQLITQDLIIYNVQGRKRKRVDFWEGQQMIFKSWTRIIWIRPRWKMRRERLGRRRRWQWWKIVCQILPVREGGYYDYKRVKAQNAKLLKFASIFCIIAPLE